MARPGISKQEVFSAAHQLLGKGVEPTIEQVRGILQTGSNSTIASYLRQWRKEQNSTEALALHSKLPEEIIAMVQGLWEKLNQLAEEKCRLLDTQHQATIKTVEQALQKYKTNNQRWQQLFYQWAEEKTQLNAEKARLEQIIILLKQNTTRLESIQDGQEKQLFEKNERIEELHQLHRQIQANLEQDRELNREQRLLEQQQFEQQKEGLQTIINAIQEKTTRLREENIKLQQSYTSLEKREASLLNENNQLHQQFVNSEKIKNEALQADKQGRDLYQKTLDKLEALHKQLVDLQIENKLLQQQSLASKQAHHDMLTDKNILAQEKWALAQEKAQLEGQVKQLQALIEA